MRYLAAVLIVLVSLVAIVFIAGRTQPEQHLVTQSAVIAAPPALVWARLNDVANESKWRPSVRSVTMDAPQNGLPCFTEKVGISLRLCVSRTDGERLRMVTVHDDRRQFDGTWTFLVQPGDAALSDAKTTRLTITEDASVHPALWRGLMLLTGTDRTLRQYLKDMSRSFSGAPEQS